MKRVTLILILALLSCSSDDNDTSSQACIESQVVENLLNNTVPGTVFSTQENERAYRSHQKYIQVDAETHLPKLARSLRVFLLMTILIYLIQQKYLFQVKFLAA